MPWIFGTVERERIMTEYAKRCEGCVYWRSAQGGGVGDVLHICHHLLDTGKRRIDKDGKCLSKTTKRHEKLRKMSQMVLKPKPKKASNKKKVKAVEDNIVFDSMTEAEKYYGLAHGRVCAVTNNPNKTARGQHFITV